MLQSGCEVLVSGLCGSPNDKEVTNARGVRGPVEQQGFSREEAQLRAGVRRGAMAAQLSYLLTFLRD